MTRAIVATALGACLTLILMTSGEVCQASDLRHAVLNMEQLRATLHNHPLAYLRHTRADNDDVKFCGAFYQALTSGSEVHIVHPKAVAVDDSHPHLQQLSRCADPTVRTDKNYAWNTFATSGSFGTRNFRLYELDAATPLINGKNSARLIYGEPSPEHWKLPNGGFALIDVDACMYRRLTKSVALDSPYAPLDALYEVVSFRGETFLLKFERQRANQGGSAHLMLIDLREKWDRPVVCLFNNAKLSPGLREAINRGLKGKLGSE